MPGIFVSHSTADKAVVDSVVELMILGSGAPQGQIFYTSGAGTGVPAGQRFNEYIRTKVEDSGLLVAIVSPSFQSSAFSLAEVGAAWVLQNNFFPVTIPGFTHNDLDGVLVGVQVPALDDPKTLAQLNDRVCEALDLIPDTARWNEQQAKFLAGLDELVSQIDMPKKVPLEELEQAEEQRDGVQTALKDSEAERSKLSRQVEELVAAKTKEEALEVVLPEEEQAQFDQLHASARDALKKLPRAVKDALAFRERSEEMPIPSPWDNEYAYDEVKQALADGYLVEGSNESVLPDSDIRDVATAMAAVDKLASFFEGTSEAFDEDFKQTHGAPPDLQKGIVWNELFG